MEDVEVVERSRRMGVQVWVVTVVERLRGGKQMGERGGELVKLVRVVKVMLRGERDGVEGLAKRKSRRGIVANVGKRESISENIRSLWKEM